jgi:predicted AAA+ superfamily ATPase
MVVEALKQRLNHGLPPDLYYYRDSGGLEVDLLLDRGDRLDAVEVKSGETLAADFFKPLDKLATLVPERTGRRALVHGGSIGHTRSQTEVLPWFGLSAWMDAGMA